MGSRTSQRWLVGRTCHWLDSTTCFVQPIRVHDVTRSLNSRSSSKCLLGSNMLTGWWFSTFVLVLISFFLNNVEKKHKKKKTSMAVTHIINVLLIFDCTVPVYSCLCTFSTYRTCFLSLSFLFSLQCLYRICTSVMHQYVKASPILYHCFFQMRHLRERGIIKKREWPVKLSAYSTPAEGARTFLIQVTKMFL